MTIPTVIHYCWFGGQPKPPDVQRCINSWNKALPDYAVMEWNESNLPVRDAYVDTALQNKLWSKVSNIVRLQVLRDQGGVYLDTDVEVVAPFGDLHGETCVLGFQQHDNAADWVNNAVLLSAPGHPFLEECIDLTLDHFRRTGEFLRSPTVTTTVLKDWGLIRYGDQRVRNVRVLPTEYFYPIGHEWSGVPASSTRSERTCCIHHWHYSWKPPASPTARTSPPTSGQARALLPEPVRLSRAVVAARRGAAMLSLQWRRWARGSARHPDDLDETFLATRGRVMSGPFAGMKYFPERHIPFVGAKLLGTFERELHVWVRECLVRGYARILDLECEDGFYAVGLATALPGSAVRAFSRSPAHRRLTQRMASLNGVANRVRVSGAPPAIDPAPSVRSLIIARAGSVSTEVLDPARSLSLLHSDLLLELSEPTASSSELELLHARFGATHDTRWVSAGVRSSADCPLERQSFSRATRLGLVDEFRNATRWGFLTARSVAP